MFNCNDWIKSVTTLCFEINGLYKDKSQTSSKAKERGEYFFSDSDVPVPRPSTALAWASLCAFGPINGFKGPNGEIQEFNPIRGNFLLPFLPALRHNDEQNQSLARSSSAHSKDRFGRIQWGSIFIGDAVTGSIIETLDEGSYAALEWADKPKASNYLRRLEQGQHNIPPLYAAQGYGWQFGVIQNISGFHQNLREPMIELAKSGIFLSAIIGKHNPQIRVRRLMIRFLNVKAAQVWAKAYSDSIKLHNNQEAIKADTIQISREIDNLIQVKKMAAEKIEYRNKKNRGGIDKEFFSRYLNQIDYET